MPVLIWAIRLFSVFGVGIVQSLAGMLTNKLAIVALVVTAIGAVTVAFFAALLALINTLAYALPNEFAIGLSFVVPANAPLCVGAIATAHVVRWVYEWNVKVIQYRLN